MSTDLTDPITETETVTTQDIPRIILNMDSRELEFHISNIRIDGSEYSRKVHFNKFSDMGPTQQQDIRDVLNNTRQYARSIGILGDGQDSDDISG